MDKMGHFKKIRLLEDSHKEGTNIEDRMYDAQNRLTIPPFQDAYLEQECYCDLTDVCLDYHFRQEVNDCPYCAVLPTTRVRDPLLQVFLETTSLSSFRTPPSLQPMAAA